MTESEVLFQMSNLVNGHLSYSQAVEQIHRLLQHENIGLPAADRIAGFAAQQLGMLLDRSRLVEGRAHLKQQIAAIERDLAERKLMQRAEGLLISRRGMLASAARHWIAEQAHRTGLSKQDVADRIIAYYQATGLLQQRIA